MSFKIESAEKAEFATSTRSSKYDEILEVISGLEIGQMFRVEVPEDSTIEKYKTNLAQAVRLQGDIPAGSRIRCSQMRDGTVGIECKEALPPRKPRTAKAKPSAADAIRKRKAS